MDGASFVRLGAAMISGTGQNIYGGGKLGLYSFWDTCNANNAPIFVVNNNTTAPNQYEFYNYSLHGCTANNNNIINANPQEIGNQFLDGSGNMSTQAALYYNDFFNDSQTCNATSYNNSGCVNIWDELYYGYVRYPSAGPGNPTLQARAAIQIAYQNYLQYLHCVDLLTGSNNNGLVTSCSASNNNCYHCNESGNCNGNSYNP